MKVPPLTHVMRDPNLLGPWFAGESWNAWHAVLKAAFAQPMTADEREIFAKLAGGRSPPKHRVKELWIVSGRRSGKDSVASGIACYASAFIDHRRFLRPGEKATVLCLACDREQAQVAMRYTKAYFSENRLLKPLVERELKDGLELTNGSELLIATNDFRTIRGRTIALAIMDEVAFYNSERSITPDTEVYAALAPSLVTLPDSMLIGISTPYARRGLLYDKWRTSYGQDDDDVLVIQASSRQLNPLLDQRIIDAAIATDPQAANAEWLGQFRSDVAAFVDRTIVEAAIISGRFELPPQRNINYVAFCDPSGGSSDSMTLCIGHREADTAVIDLVRESPAPFSPDTVCREFSETLTSYNCRTVVGDRYGGAWPRERFDAYGVRYEPADRPKSQIYLDALPGLMSGRIELLDHPKLLAQLCRLERRTARGGRDSIDHPPGSHDDVANAVLGCVNLLLSEPDSLAIWNKLATPGSTLTPAWARVYTPV